MPNIINNFLGSNKSRYSVPIFLNSICMNQASTFFWNFYYNYHPCGISPFRRRQHIYPDFIISAEYINKQPLFLKICRIGYKQNDFLSVVNNHRFNRQCAPGETCFYCIKGDWFFHHFPFPANIAGDCLH